MDNWKHTRKYFSYPNLCGSSSEPPQLYSYGPSIYMLPNEIIFTIFKFLTYHEISQLRRVCRWFDNLAGRALNKAFLMLSESVDRKIEEIKGELNKVSEVRLNNLYIVQSEVKVLEACCKDYVLNDMFYFSGGLLLDSILEILKKSNNCSQLISKLFFLIEDFLDYFDFIIEPGVVKKSVHLPLSWFGKKIIDVIDCCLTSDKNIQIDCQAENRNNHCQLEVRYEAANLFSVKRPPSFDQEVVSFNELFILAKYVRDHIRWNNVLSMKTDEIWCKLPCKKIVRENSAYLIKQEVQYKRAMFSDTGKFIITLHLVCLRSLAPIICQNYFTDNLQSLDSTESFHISADDYEFSMLMEVGFWEKESNKRVYNVNCISLTQVDDTCFQSSYVKEHKEM